MPVVVMFLTRLGIITPMTLVSIRKYAYFVLLVIAAIITPPELLSHLMVTLPLLVLYEISIGISYFSYKKSMKVQEEEEKFHVQ
jgi:sec-independent protein translocase protein TatC